MISKYLLLQDFRSEIHISGILILDRARRKELTDTKSEIPWLLFRSLSAGLYFEADL